MNVPSARDPVWQALIEGDRQMEFSFLAAKFCVTRARLEIRQNPNAIARLSQELHDLYEKNAQLPSAQQDMAKLQ